MKGPTIKYYKLPWPIRIAGGRKIPRGIYATADVDEQRALSKALHVHELPADSPEVVAAKTIKAAEQAGGGKLAKVLDKIAPDWRDTASKLAHERRDRKAREAQAVIDQRRISEAAARGENTDEVLAAIEAEREARARAAGLAPAPAAPASLSSMPDGVTLPTVSEAVASVLPEGVAAAAVFSPVAVIDGKHTWNPHEAADGWERCGRCHLVVSPGSPDEARNTKCEGKPVAPEMSMTAADLAGPGAPLPPGFPSGDHIDVSTGQPDAAMTKGPAPAALTEAVKPEAAAPGGPDFDYMTKSQVRDWLKLHAVQVDGHASLNTLRATAKAAFADEQRAKAKG